MTGVNGIPETRRVPKSNGVPGARRAQELTGHPWGKEGTRSSEGAQWWEPGANGMLEARRVSPTQREPGVLRAPGTNWMLKIRKVKGTQGVLGAWRASESSKILEARRASGTSMKPESIGVPGTRISRTRRALGARRAPDSVRSQNGGCLELKGVSVLTAHKVMRSEWPC